MWEGGKLGTIGLGKRGALGRYHILRPPGASCRFSRLFQSCGRYSVLERVLKMAVALPRVPLLACPAVFFPGDLLCTAGQASSGKHVLRGQLFCAVTHGRSACELRRTVCITGERTMKRTLLVGIVCWAVTASLGCGICGGPHYCTSGSCAICDPQHCGPQCDEPCCQPRCNPCYDPVCDSIYGGCFGGCCDPICGPALVGPCRLGNCGCGCDGCDGPSCGCCDPCSAGCCEGCGDSCCDPCCDSSCGVHSDGRYALHRVGGFLRCIGRLFVPNRWCGISCGERYWGDFYGDPPDCCDPCDRCGNFTGSYGRCGGEYVGGMWMTPDCATRAFPENIQAEPVPHLAEPRKAATP